MKTQLYDWHAKNGDIVDFAGFKMPVMYSSIKEEHLIVREAVGIFDVSHMGRMWIQGKDSEKFLNILVTRDLSKTPPGRAAYTFMLNEQGGFRDDLVFERIEQDKWLLVWNAGNLKKIDLWINSLLKIINHFTNLDVSLTNISSTSAMFALQGPKAREVLSLVLNNSNEPPLPWRILSTRVNGIEMIISGTGYSGESGYEIIIMNTSVDDPSNAFKIWELILEIGKKYSIKPCGLGARDSLRLEAGLSLYGNDIDENTNPVQADLFFPPFVHIEKTCFIGKSQLEVYQEHHPSKIRVGLIALDKGPSPRAGLKLFKNGKNIGQITSGGFSPLLNIGVGMGYIDTEFKNEGTHIQFEVRGKLYDAKVVKFPLYDPTKYGSKRKI
jgi:aminomethyltransferase